MNINKNYAKFVDRAIAYAPSILDWSRVHTETYPEVVFDEETGEERETGKTLTSEWTETHRYLYPTREQYADMGYLRVVDRAPTESAGEGMEWKAVGTGDAESDYEMVEPEDRPAYYLRRYEAVAVPSAEVPTSAPRVFSKLKIYAAISALGAWDAVKAWLEEKTINGMNGWMAFSLAQDIGESNELFVPLASEVRVLLGLSEEQFEATLAQCVLEA